MNARQAQLSMLAIELHEQEFSGEEFAAWLLGLEDADPDAIGRVLLEEARRAYILAENHYQRVTSRVAVLNPEMIAQVGFIQGMTFAAAALGRQPYPAHAPSAPELIRNAVNALKAAAVLDGAPQSVAAEIGLLDVITRISVIEDDDPR